MMDDFQAATTRSSARLDGQWVANPVGYSHGLRVVLDCRAFAGDHRHVGSFGQLPCRDLAAVMLTSGSTGESIPLRNPISGKSFVARVEGKGRASVGKGDL